MALIIDKEIWEAFPRMQIVVAAGDGLDNRSLRDSVSRLLEQAQQDLQAGWSHPNPQSHPHIAAWRAAFSSLGFSGKRFPSSIEALTRRVLSGRGLTNINPLVDFYNAVSLQHVVPAGGWDLDDLKGDIRLHFTEGREPFHELGTSKLANAQAGEAAYSSSGQLVTRHFVWRQSEQGKIAPSTRRFLLVSEILGPVGRETAERVRESFAQGLREHFGLEARTEILGEGVSRWVG